MNSRKSVVILGMLIAVAAGAKGTVPADVRAFVSNADHCQHFAGEWDSDLSPQRRRAIERGADKYCLAAQRRLKQVETKYRHDEVLRDLIAQHRYDAVVSYSK